jgi:hypothetical protein
MAMTTPVAGEDGGTYKTPSKWAIHITTSAALNPCRSEDTNARPDCSDGPVDGPYLPAEEVAKRGEVLWRQRVRRRSYLALFLIFVLIFVVTSRGFGLKQSILL